MIGMRCLRLTSWRGAQISAVFWPVLLAFISPLAKAQDAAPPAPTLDVPSAAHEVVRTPIRSDKNHPVRFLPNSYPAESVAKGEKGFCLLRAQVDADGVVRAAQVVSSAGYARLDAACMNSFIGAKMIPATADGKPVSTWADIPISWGKGIPLNPKRDYSMVPHFDSDFELKVGPDYYPAESREKGQEGACLVHVSVSAQGTPIEADISRSTGYAPLDKACVAAVHDAHFIPAISGDRSIVASTYIYIGWRLTKP